jgi:hypothetical protein
MTKRLRVGQLMICAASDKLPESIIRHLVNPELIDRLMSANL